MENNLLDIESISPDLNSPKPNAKKLKWFVILAFIVVAIASLVVLLNKYVKSFTDNAGISSQHLLSIAKQGWENNPFENQNSYTILFLGLDQVGQIRQNSLLTDSILLINISKSGDIKLFPIPRDLWINSLKTKVNALYYYGEKSPEITGEKLVESTIAEITGIPIDFHVILDLNSVKEIIDLAGGVEVYVDHAFTDNEFPRDDVPPDILPIELRYKTITFEKGMQSMSGDTALEFIRSRKSHNEQENTDESRSIRQQKVIFSLASKLSNLESFKNPAMYGRLYNYWHNHISSNIPDEWVIGMIKSLSSIEPSYVVIPLPVQSATQSGIIFNPPIKKYQQWVYEPIDSSWQEFAKFFQENLETSTQ